MMAIIQVLMIRRLFDNNYLGKTKIDQSTINTNPNGETTAEKNPFSYY
jgi:hypothetical protein